MINNIIYKKSTRFISAFIAAVSVFCVICLAYAAPMNAHAANPTSFSVKADKTSVHPDDEITFTVSMSSVTELYACGFFLDIPEGLSYIKGSASVGSALTNCTAAKNADFTESTLYFLFATDNSKGFYTSSSSTTLLTFKCRVGSNADGNYSVGLSSLGEEFFDKDYNDIPYSLSAASVSVAPRVSGVALNKSTLTLDIGQKETLTASVKPSDASNKNVTFSSSSSKIATVNSSGAVTGVSEGTATITVKTSEGGYTASCKVTVKCSHKSTTVVPEKPSTCLVHGTSSYTVCDDCGKIVSGSKTELPLASHSYGKLIAEVPSTYTSEGVKAHYKCSVCGKLFDVNKKAVTAAQLVIEKPEQDYEYKFNDRKHWLESEYGDKKDESSHTLKWVVDTPATESEEGVKHQECICGYKTSENTPIEKLDHIHSMKKTDAVAATCIKGGNVEYYHCDICNRNFSDIDGLNELDGVETPIDENAHSGGEATCTEKAVCELCGKEYGEPDPEAHKNTEIIGAKDATDTEEGYTGDIVCRDCGETVEEGEVIPKAVTTDSSSDSIVSDPPSDISDGSDISLQPGEASDSDSSAPIAGYIAIGIGILILLAVAIVIVIKKIRG